MNLNNLTFLDCDNEIISIAETFLKTETGTLSTERFCYDKHFMSLLPGLETKIILIDITFPCADITILISKIKTLRKDISIIVSSAWVQYDLVYRCLRSGASAYLNKFGSKKYYIETIIEVKNNKAHLSLPVAECLKKDLNNSNGMMLTGKEVEIISMISKGYSYRELSNFFNESIESILGEIFNIYKMIHYQK